MGNIPTKVPSLQEPSVKVDPQLRRAIAALNEALDIRLGRRGDPLDRAVTLRELIDGQIVSLGRGGNVGPPSDPGGDGLPGEYPTDQPHAPVNFDVIGAFMNIRVSWNKPQYNGHSHTEIWRSPAEKDEFGDWISTPAPAFSVFDPDSNPSGAVLVGTSVADMYTDPVGLDKGYFYWVRHIRADGLVGPLNKTEGTFAFTYPDITSIMEDLSDEINETNLAQSLNDRIDFIDTPTTGLLDRMEVVEDESGDTATKVTQLIAGDFSNYSAIEEMQTVTEGVSGEYYVKIDVNGRVTGFGLYNDATDGSLFLVKSDRFAVGSPGVNSVYPFIVDNGTVYIETALINKAAILELIAGSVVADYIESTALISSPHVLAPNINMGVLVKPDPADITTWYVNTSAGRQSKFSVDSNGIMHAEQATLKGVSIYDSSGNLIMGSGGGLDWSRVSGASKPQDNATVGAPVGTYVGSMLAEDVATKALLIDAMSDDGKLTPVEKKQMQREFRAARDAVWQLWAAADAVDVSSTTLESKYMALATYLNDGVTWSHLFNGQDPAWINGNAVETTTTIPSVTTYKTRWTEFYNALALLDKAVNAVNVNKANKISSGNISTYIANLAVDTLRIAGNAVTVPEHTQQIIQGWKPTTINSWQEALSLPVVVDIASSAYPAKIMANVSGFVGYGQGWQHTKARLVIDGTVVAGSEGDIFPAVALGGAKEITSPGTYIVKLEMYFSSLSMNGLSSASLWAMGVKR